MAQADRLVTPQSVTSDRAALEFVTDNEKTTSPHETQIIYTQVWAISKHIQHKEQPHIITFLFYVIKYMQKLI